MFTIVSAVLGGMADEISWFVHYITKDGYIYLRRNGGSDHQIAPSKRVNIHTEKGMVKAVFGWPAIHMRHTKEETPSMKNIFLDCGCASKEEVEKLGVHVGCVATFEDEFMVLNKNRYVGRALDNRVGGFMIAEVARLLKENKVTLPFSLYVVNSVQEEIGLRGAEMMAHQLNYAVVFYALRKIKRGKYELELFLITDNPSERSWGEITEAHTHLLEQEINNEPAPWLWSHKRWKREVPSDLETLKQQQRTAFNEKYNL